MREIKILQRGGVGVLPTDTIYGLVGSALREKTVERMYRLRKRNPKKPFIILIGSISDVQKFGVRLDNPAKAFLRGVWPGPVSVGLPVPQKKFAYLHRGTKTLAFRLPKTLSLRRFLVKTGPLVAPSANIEGEPPASTITAAKQFFGAGVDFYSGRGRRAGRPSTLVLWNNGRGTILREGAGLTRVRRALGAVLH